MPPMHPLQTCSDDNPYVCTECRAIDPLEHITYSLRPGLYPDPVTGVCGPCRAPHCKNCKVDDATRCDDCLPGYYDDWNNTMQCLPCDATGCCGLTEEGKCRFCAPGYWGRTNWRDDSAEKCKPCPVGCSFCDTFEGQYCERCADGYYLESGTRMCKPVSRGVAAGGRGFLASTWPRAPRGSGRSSRSPV